MFLKKLRHARALRYLLALPVILIAASQFYPHIRDYQQIEKLWHSANLIFLVAAAGVQTVQYLVDGLITRSLLKIVRFNVRLRDTLRISTIDVFASHFLPVGRAGSLAAVFYFYTRLGVSREAVVLMNFLWGIITFLTLVGTLLVSSLLLPNKALPLLGPGSRLEIVAPVLGLTVISLIMLKNQNRIRLAFHRRLMRHQGYVGRRSRVHQRLARYTWFNARHESIERWREYREALAGQRTSFVIRCATCSVSYYACDIAALGLCFIAFGASPSLALLTFAYAVADLAGMVSFVPGGLGATDAVLALLLLSARVGAVETVTAIIAYRAITLWLPFTAGALSYVTLNRDVQRRTRDSEAVP